MLSLVIVFVILVIGSITDLKTTEVPDWLNFAGIAAGIGLHALAAISAWSVQPLIEGLLGLGVFIALGLVMYYTGQWGGGDSKLMMAVGSLLGFQFSLNHTSVAFLINSLLAGAVYGLGWVVWIAIKKHELFAAHLRSMMKKPVFVVLRGVALLFMLVFGMLSFFAGETPLRLLLIIIAVFFPFITYAFLLTKTVEQACMIRTASPAELTEGDWIVNDVIVSGRRIAGPKDLGISSQQIHELQQLAKHHKFTITVKDGIPFVPSFLIAFIATLLLGNPLGWVV